MAQPTTSPRQNTIRRTADRNEPRPRIPTGKPAGRPQGTSFNWGAALDRWFTDQRSTLTLGVLMMGVAVGLMVAFVSYLIDGPADQSVVGAAFSETLAESATETRNWLVWLALTLPMRLYFAGLVWEHWRCRLLCFLRAIN